MPTSRPATIWCDSTSAISLTSNPVLHHTTKHLAISFHFVRERVDDDSLVVLFVPTSEQQVDVITKALPRELFQHFGGKLMRETPISLRGGVVPIKHQ